MHIYHKDEDLGLKLEQDLFYSHYTEKQHKGLEGSYLYAYDFHTKNAHKLQVDYEKEVYKMVFCFKGYSDTYIGKQKQYTFTQGKMLLYKTLPHSYTSVLKSNLEYQIVHLHLNPQLIGNVKEQFPKLFESPILGVSIPVTSYRLWRDVQGAPISQNLQSLLVEKIVYEQLYHITTVLNQTRTLHTSDADLKKLADAKHILDHANGYLSISELARMVGVNTFKLKKLFREQLQTSIFAYQVEQQLGKAYQMLHDKQLNIPEVALLCGYESVSSFSNAFLRKFGQRPGKIKKLPN